MFFYRWAKKWNVPDAAIAEWEHEIGIDAIQTPHRIKSSEQAVQNLIRLEASRKGLRLWRNNVGAVHTQDGSFMRYGLANESSNMNRHIKSADLIGIRPIKIKAEMIGLTIGQFVSREIKKSTWRFTKTPPEIAQLRWAELISALGGDACFANGEGTL